MAAYQEKVVAIYKQLSRTPSLDLVAIVSDDMTNVLHWQAVWSFRDIVKQCKVSYSSTGSLSVEDGKLVTAKNHFTNETTQKMISISSSKLVACLRELEVKSEKHDFLEIWNKSQKRSSIDLTKENKHGIVHTNSIFGCLKWSNSSDKLVYIAEKKTIENKGSLFVNTLHDNNIIDKFVHREDWGEQLVGSYHPMLFMFSVDSEEITSLSEYLPFDVSASFAVWSKNDECLYVLAWKATPWKLGLKSCKNRYSALYKLDLRFQECTKLTDDSSCVFSLQITPDGTKLIYLESTPFGPHMQCVKMMCIDLDNPTKCNKRTIVDIVEHQEDPNCFQGLFVDEMSDNCWLSNGHQLVVSSLHRSNKALLCIDINSGKVTLLETVGTWNIFCVETDILFASFSSPSVPTVFKIGKFDLDKIIWLDVDVPVPQLEKIQWDVLEHKPKEDNQQFSGLEYESILVKPSMVDHLKGLIINPHSGPHRTHSASFDLFSACFCRLGYAVLHVNFRGSAGFGQNSIMSLPGNIGKQDVSDVQQAAETVLQNLNICSNNVFVYGGSHGGNLTLQLVGQYPHFYCAGAAKNPVSNLLIQQTSDIIDWCYLEGGSTFSYDIIPSSSNMLKFLNCSPVVHVGKVQAPLLFMLGLSDVRVPPSQSFEYVHALKGVGKKVKVLTYPNNNHPISAVECEADCFVNMAKWFFDHSRFNDND